MAQAAVEARKLKKTIGTQTGDSDEMMFYISNKKIVRLYYSKVYKERVVSLNLSSSKSFVLNKVLWNQFRKLFPFIDKYFENGE